jgi:hypothetical protein
LGPKRDEVTEEWRNIRNEKLNDLYCSPNIVRVIKLRKMRWAGHVARMMEGKMYIWFWWGNLREKDHFGRPIRTWEDNIKMDLKVVGCEGMD